MSTVSDDRVKRDWDPEEPAEPLTRRPRRQFFNRRSAALVALITCAAGFYAGVRVEKSDVSGSSTLRVPTAAAAAGGRAGRAGATGASGAGGATGAAGASGAAGGARTGGFAGFAGGAGGASVGTVASVNGTTLVLTETSGNTVKVRLTSATKITKNQSVKRSAVRPGDTIIVQGATNSSGTTVAGTVTDSGASAASRSSSSTGSSSGASGSGGVGSLFSSGG